MAIKPDLHEKTRNLLDEIEEVKERVAMAFSFLNELTEDALTLARLFSELEARVSKLESADQWTSREIEEVKKRVASLER